MKKLTIGHLYPDLLNLYGDRAIFNVFGNVSNGGGWKRK